MSNNDPFPFGPMGDDERFANDCVPPNPFAPSVDYLQVLPGPTMLEALKAVRDCFKGTNGKIPTAPLDELIARYDFTFEIKTDVTVDGEQLEANRNIPPSNELGGTGGMD